MSELQQKNCPLCGYRRAFFEREETRNADAMDCQFCGKFYFTDEFKYRFGGDNEAKIKIARALRQVKWKHVNHNDKLPIVSETEAEPFLETSEPLPNPRKQADNLLRLIVEAWNEHKNEDNVQIYYSNQGVSVGAISERDFDALLKWLNKKELIEWHGSYNPLEYEGLAPVTVDGLEYYEELKKGSVAYREGFMAMAFGNETLADLFEKHLKPAVEQTGFELCRLDEKPEAGSIDNRLRVAIQTAAFVVADLTDANPGAYFEAGYAEALGKPVIYICEKSKWEAKGTHFDTNHHQTIIWSKDDPEKAAEELKNIIRATLPNQAKMQDD